MPPKIKMNLTTSAKSFLQRFITLSKLSIAAATFMFTVAWIASIYLQELPIPTVEEFRVKQSPVVEVGDNSPQISVTVALNPSEIPSQDAPSPESQAREALGQMGDFFGGMLNPILAFASFIALLYTIRIQSDAQNKATLNSVTDRKLSYLIPEHARLFEILQKQTNLIEVCLTQNIDINGEITSINKLIGKHKQKFSNDPKYPDAIPVGVIYQSMKIDLGEGFSNSDAIKCIREAVMLKSTISTLDKLQVEICKLTHIKLETSSYSLTARSVAKQLICCFVFSEALSDVEMQLSLADLPSDFDKLLDEVARNLRLELSTKQE